jgi:DNA-binding HxlR family transcriptional regulator
MIIVVINGAGVKESATIESDWTLAEDTAVAQTQQEEQVCPVARAAELFGDHWTLLLIRDLASGCRRFQQLQHSIGISPGVLSARLRKLEAVGVITRTQYPEIPPRVEYQLTEKGRAAVPLIEQLRLYGEDWLLDVDCPDEDLDLDENVG